MATYQDPKIECTDSEIIIRGNYFPWGSKRIPYSSVRSFERFDMTALGGKGRIWGSGDLRHWANLDGGRPKKSVGFYIDVGARIIPFVTPDDPDAFDAAVREHAH